MPSLRKLSFVAPGILLIGTFGVLVSCTRNDQGKTASVSACRPADSVAVVGVATRFHEMLATGDTIGITALLAPDLRVLEGGTVENREEYLSHHLSEDIAFAKAVPDNRTSASYTCEGDVAWLVSTSTAIGKFGSRDINSVGAELLLLSRTPTGWNIRAIHWSSAKRAPR
jgi:hypothetical protein